LVFFFRCRFVAVSYFLKFGLLVLGYRIFPCFLLFRFGKFHYMVYRNLALYGLAYLYLTFGIVMDGLPINLSVREAVATAFLHIVQNVRDAIVYVLGWVSVTFCKEFIFRCSLLQKHLYGPFEMVCCLHIVNRFNQLYIFPFSRNSYLLASQLSSKHSSLH